MTTLQISGLAAVSLSDYRAYSSERPRVSNASAAAASGVTTGIHFAAAGTTSRIPLTIFEHADGAPPARASKRG